MFINPRDSQKQKSERLAHKNLLKHDLKNRLTIIQGYAALLLKRMSSQKGKRWTKKILRESSKLNDIIDERVK